MNNNSQKVLPETFKLKRDRFGSVIIDFNIKENESLIPKFEELLTQSLKKWNEKKVTACWIVVPLRFSHQILPILNTLNFEFHNAQGKNATLNKWLRKGTESKIPEFSRCKIGVGGLVVDFEKKEVLLVQENYKKLNVSFWKLPGGNMNYGEKIEEVVEREILEETGIQANYFDMIGFRYLYSAYYKTQDDVYFICILTPKTKEISKDDDEIKKCKWFTFEEYFNFKNEEISYATNTTNVKIRDCFKKYLKENRKERKLVNIDDVSWTIPFNNKYLKSYWFGINS